MSETVTPGALRHPVFRRLYAAQVVALAGTGLLTVALGLLAFDLAGSAAGAVLGSVLAIKMLAYVFIAPLIATVVDRLPRRGVLIGADLTRAGVAVGLPFVAEVWQVLVLVFILQAASATFTPAFQAVIPAVLRDEQTYTRGLALSRLAYDLEAMASPVLAAVLLTVMSYNSLFVGTAAGFIASALLVRGTDLPTIGVDRSPWRRRLWSGMRIMVTDNDLRALLAMNLAAAAATGLVLVNTVVYVQGMLGGGQSAVAVALACYGFGSMAAALLVPRLLREFADRVIMLVGAGAAAAGLLVVVAALAVFGLNWITLVGTWVLLGAATSMVNTPAGRLLRRAATEANRTAVFTAQFSLSHAGYLVTYPLAGWGGAMVNQGFAAAILAILSSIAALAAIWIVVRGTGGKARQPTRTPPEPRPRQLTGP